MQIRVITMRYSEGVQGFSEETLRNATHGHEVLDCRHEFFTFGNIPHIALVLTLADADGSAGGHLPVWRKEGDANPEETMNDEQRRVYRALRKWRNEATKARGLPTYAFGRNALLAEIVRRAPKSLAALKEVAGVSEKFCKAHGKAVLAIVGDLEAAAEGDVKNDGGEGDEPQGEGADQAGAARAPGAEGETDGGRTEEPPQEGEEEGAAAGEEETGGGEPAQGEMPF